MENTKNVESSEQNDKNINIQSESFAPYLLSSHLQTFVIFFLLHNVFSYVTGKTIEMTPTLVSKMVFVQHQNQRKQFFT